MIHISAGIYSWQCRVQAEAESLFSSLKLKHKLCDTGFLFPTLQSPETTLQLDAETKVHLIRLRCFKGGLQGKTVFTQESKACLFWGESTFHLSGFISKVSWRNEISQPEIHFVRTDKSCHHFLAYLLVHNKADFRSWECLGARIFILSSSSNLYINKWNPLCLCCLAWSTKLCWPTVVSSSALMT